MRNEDAAALQDSPSKGRMCFLVDDELRRAEELFVYVGGFTNHFATLLQAR